MQTVCARVSTAIECGTGSGGSATQSELIYGRIRALAKQTKTPVYTFAEDVAASGACALTSIIVLQSSCLRKHA